MGMGGMEEKEEKHVLGAQGLYVATSYRGKDGRKGPLSRILFLVPCSKSQWCAPSHL
jgi:hypothetical protein